MHIEKAKSIRSKLQNEVQKIKRVRNSCRKHGVKNLSAAIGEQQCNALLCIARGEDTQDGGKKGQLTSNPSDIDWVVRRAWKKIYDGIGGCIDTAVERYFNKCAAYILKTVPFEVAELDGESLPSLL